MSSQRAAIYSPHEDQFEDRQMSNSINEAIEVPAAPEIAALTFMNYEIKFPQKISFVSTDDDLTLVIRSQANEQNDSFPSFTYGRLNNTFILEERHCHFAHGEYHEVYYNSKYRNYNEATKHRDGVAVLVTFMEQSNKQDNNVPFRSKKIFHPESINVTLPSKPIALEELLSNETDSFCRYFGSITTLNFNEDASWTVFDEHIALYLNGKFRGLFNEEGRPIEDNVRPVQSS